MMQSPRRWQRPPSPSPFSALRRPQSTWLVVLLVAGAAWAYGEWSKMRTPAGEPVSGLARAADGDSLEIDGQRIRLFGIDAPELRQLCQNSGGEIPCGLEARDALAALVRGKTVTCTPEEAERSYDRIVAICRTDSVSDFSETMIRDGHAIELLAHSRGQYAAAERSAKDAKRGIWAGHFERPGQWRERMGR
jgi:endonuclease YncB( thermonuclease family)